MKLEIEKMLVISTGHITYNDMKVLSDGDSNDYPYTRLSTEYGIIIFLTSDMVIPPRSNSADFILDSNEKPSLNVSAFSKEFIEILRIAKDNKCCYINFDSDGTIVPELKEFDW